MAADGLPVVIRTIEGAALEVTLDRGAVPTRGFEVGVNLRTVCDIAATGVDRISIGALTKDVRAIDFSMRFQEV